MNPFKKLVEDHRHTKCLKTFQRIQDGLRYNTSDPKTYVMYLGTTRGYDELFKMCKEMGWYVDITGDNREGVFLTIKEDHFNPRPRKKDDDNA